MSSIPHIQGNSAGGALARPHFASTRPRGGDPLPVNAENADAGLDLSELLRNLPPDLVDSIGLKGLASRSVAASFSPENASIFRAYNRNPNSIYLIHLVTSLLPLVAHARNKLPCVPPPARGEDVDLNTKHKSANSDGTRRRRRRARRVPRPVSERAAEI